MRKLAAIGAVGVLASALFGQGLNTGGQHKDDWEEINFEFNSSILSDGYPSLLRLAELLSQHRDYKVKVTGHTDYVGSAAYNDKLAMHRAEAVKAFLVRYGAADSQITTAGDGKRSPEVDNKSKEGRFMNRRVVLAVTDGKGALVKEGGISEVLPTLIDRLNDMAKRQQECCEQILKKLDKLDDILAALKNLQGENDKLRAELNDQRNQLNTLKDQVSGAARPPSAEQIKEIAHTEAMGAVDESQRRNKKFSNINVNIGPTMGKGKTGDFSFDGRGQFFSPFGGDGVRAVQAQGEYMYYPGRQEGQFDLGLVNRFNSSLQAGAFASFKYLNFKDMQSAGGLGQASFLLDYIFSRGRIGIFATKGFKNEAVMNSIQLAPGVFQQTYARIADQVGGSALVGVWGNAYLEGNIGYLRSHQHNNSPGGQLRLVQPISEHFAFTIEGDLNESLLALTDSGRIQFGFQVGNYIHPKDYGKTKSPVPMDVPRIRYEILTRRVGSAPPVAIAGPDQNGVAAGQVNLDGSASYDPLGEALTYAWSQVSGPTVALSTPNAAKTSFSAAAGQSYVFKLTVTNTDGLSNSAVTRVSATSPTSASIVRFDATPANISAGQTSTLNWVVQGATSISINNGVGTVAATGSAPVSPSQTTTYTLTATGPAGTVTASATVTVGTGGTTGNPQIVRYEGSPLTIAPGGSSTLSWTTTGAATVSISGVGSVPANGSTTVSPTQTTTYTLTATSSDGKSVTAPVTITVASGSVPQIVVFVATPQNIDAGQSTKLCWQVTGATSIQIQPGVGSNLNANDCATISPTTTTTYTLTATNGTGQIQGNVTVNVGQVRILSFTANPVTSTAAGNPVVLTWQTENATSVVLVGSEISPQNLQPNGTFTVNPITNSTYTLTAYGPGGQTVSVTISVFVR
ncbi:MAG TPA: OmpA family protein [Candidatus Acidoferrales bacterium]|nr:OmpA family protein [Candidatus Acidoferrales bacterium]